MPKNKEKEQDKKVFSVDVSLKKAEIPEIDFAEETEEEKTAWLRLEELLVTNLRKYPQDLNKLLKKFNFDLPSSLANYYQGSEKAPDYLLKELAVLMESLKQKNSSKLLGISKFCLAIGDMNFAHPQAQMEFIKREVAGTELNATKAGREIGLALSDYQKAYENLKDTCLELEKLKVQQELVKANKTDINAAKELQRKIDNCTDAINLATELNLAWHRIYDLLAKHKSQCKSRESEMGGIYLAGRDINEQTKEAIFEKEAVIIELSSGSLNEPRINQLNEKLSDIGWGAIEQSVIKEENYLNSSYLNDRDRLAFVFKIKGETYPNIESFVESIAATGNYSKENLKILISSMLHQGVPHAVTSMSAELVSIEDCEVENCVFRNNAFLVEFEDGKLKITSSFSNSAERDFSNATLGGYKPASPTICLTRELVIEINNVAGETVFSLSEPETTVSMAIIPVPGKKVQVHANVLSLFDTDLISSEKTLAELLQKEEELAPVSPEITGKIHYYVTPQESASEPYHETQPTDLPRQFANDEEGGGSQIDYDDLMEPVGSDDMEGLVRQIEEVEEMISLSGKPTTAFLETVRQLYRKQVEGQISARSQQLLSSIEKGLIAALNNKEFLAQLEQKDDYATQVNDIVLSLLNPNVKQLNLGKNKNLSKEEKTNVNRILQKFAVILNTLLHEGRSLIPSFNRKLIATTAEFLKEINSICKDHSELLDKQNESELNKLRRNLGFYLRQHIDNKIKIPGDLVKVLLETVDIGNVAPGQEMYISTIVDFTKKFNQDWGKAVGYFDSLDRWTEEYYQENNLVKTADPSRLKAIRKRMPEIMDMLHEIEVNDAKAISDKIADYKTAVAYAKENLNIQCVNLCQQVGFKLLQSNDMQARCIVAIQMYELLKFLEAKLKTFSRIEQGKTREIISERINECYRIFKVAHDAVGEQLAEANNANLQVDPKVADSLISVLELGTETFTMMRDSAANKGKAVERAPQLTRYLDLSENILKRAQQQADFMSEGQKQRFNTVIIKAADKATKVKDLVGICLSELPGYEARLCEMLGSNMEAVRKEILADILSEKCSDLETVKSLTISKKSVEKIISTEPIKEILTIEAKVAIAKNHPRVALQIARKLAGEVYGTWLTNMPLIGRFFKLSSERMVRLRNLFKILIAAQPACANILFQSKVWNKFFGSATKQEITDFFKEVIRQGQERDPNHLRVLLATIAGKPKIEAHLMDLEEEVLTLLFSADPAMAYKILETTPALLNKCEASERLKPYAQAFNIVNNPEQRVIENKAAASLLLQWFNDERHLFSSQQRSSVRKAFTMISAEVLSQVLATQDLNGNFIPDMFFWNLFKQGKALVDLQAVSKALILMLEPDIDDVKEPNSSLSAFFQSLAEKGLSDTGNSLKDYITKTFLLNQDGKGSRYQWGVNEAVGTCYPSPLAPKPLRALVNEMTKKEMGKKVSQNICAYVYKI